MKTSVMIAFGLASLVSASVASAQPSVLTKRNDTTPSFATLDRGDAHSRFGITASQTFITDDDSSRAFRFDIYGQAVLNNGLGVYASVPIVHLSDKTSSADGNHVATSVAGIEVGGLYSIAMQKDLWLTVRGGVVAAGDANNVGRLARPANALPRTTDIATTLPDTDVARASASLSGRTTKSFFRADLGVDVPLNGPEDMEFDPLVRLNVGAGVYAGPVAIMGELVTVATTADVRKPQTHTAAITTTWMSKSALRPTVSLIVPLNNTMSDSFDASLMLGLRGHLN